MSCRVVITGIGVRAPGASGTKEFWDLLSSGSTATRRISFFDPSPYRSQVAGECDFDAELEGLTAREIRRMDRVTQFAAVCTDDAVADSGLELTALDPHRIGVSLGSAVAASTSLDREYQILSDAGKQRNVDPGCLSPHMFDYLTPGVAPAEVAWRVGAEGPVAMVSNGCTSGLDAVGNAVQMIREGTADVMLAGAADTPISPIVVACFDAIKATEGRLPRAAAHVCLDHAGGGRVRSDFGAVARALLASGHPRLLCSLHAGGRKPRGAPPLTGSSEDKPRKTNLGRQGDLHAIPAGVCV